MLGLSFQETNDARIVTEVGELTQAEEMGVKVGWIVVKVGGEPVTPADTYDCLVKAKTAGKPFTITFEVPSVGFRSEGYFQPGSARWNDVSSDADSYWDMGSGKSKVPPPVYMNIEEHRDSAGGWSGEWRSIEGRVHIIRGARAIFHDGSEAEFTALSATECTVTTTAGVEYRGKLEEWLGVDSLVWSDGDVWTKVENPGEPWTFLRAESPVRSLGDPTRHSSVDIADGPRVALVKPGALGFGIKVPAHHVTRGAEGQKKKGLASPRDKINLQPKGGATSPFYRGVDKKSAPSLANIFGGMNTGPTTPLGDSGFSTGFNPTGGSNLSLPKSEARKRADSVMQPEDNLPLDGFRRIWSNSKQKYYYWNQKTQEARWSHPKLWSYLLNQWGLINYKAGFGRNTFDCPLDWEFLTAETLIDAVGMPSRDVATFQRKLQEYLDSLDATPWRKYLAEWGLAKYAVRFRLAGFDKVGDWSLMDSDILSNDIGMTKQHIAIFRRQLSELTTFGGEQTVKIFKQRSQAGRGTE